MKLTFLGCGDAFSEKLGNNSALLEWGETNLLIDIPDSNYRNIKRLNKDYSDIENIFITHLHADHINGLERFAYYRKYVTPVLHPNKENKKPDLFVPETIYFGLWDSVKNGLGITTEGIKSLEDYFNVHLIKITDESGNLLEGIDGVGSFELNGVTFNITPSEHVPNMPVYGLFVQDEFYYSADCVYNPEAMNFYFRNTKKIFHDLHFFDKKIPTHASIKDFQTLGQEKEKIYGMHYDDSKIDEKEVNGLKLVKPGKTIEI